KRCTSGNSLLHCVGEEAREVFESFDLTEEEVKDPDAIIKKFEGYFVPEVNQSMERHRFNTRSQAKNENIEAYLADLRKIASNCNFGNLKNELIKDRIVCGVHDKRVKDRLLREQDLTLEKAVAICKAAEVTESMLKGLSEDKLEVSA
ncbi:hypothetical protein PPYR_15712, partial [Photinus pyralis]